MGKFTPVSSVWIQLLLFVALMGEVLSSTFWIETLGINACRWIHFFSGIVIGGGILFRTSAPVPRAPQLHQGVFYLLLCSLIVWVGIRLNYLFKLNPLDYTHADMLPVIRVMADRFIHSQPVYEVIPEIWGGVMPVYLPGLWLPFVPALALNIDLRWITTLFILSSLIFLFTLIRGNKRSLLVWIPIGLWFDFILYNRNETMVWSEEGVVYGYYMLFALALYLRSYLGIGVLLACCLLSRYSIVFFASSLMACIYFYESAKNFRSIFLSATITGLVLITLGGAWSSLLQFIGLPGQYLKNLESNPAKYQEVMSQGLGFVPWLQGLDDHWIYRIMLVSLIVLAVLIFYFYRRWSDPLYLLAGLKFTLLIFYHLVLIPYPYLFYTSVWVSVVLVYIYFNHVNPIKIAESS